MLDPFWQLRTPGGTLAGYLSDHVALIDTGESGHRALAVSMLPLRTEDASGDPVPVDLSLVRHGDAYSPAHPLAPLSLPASLDQGIRLPEAGIALKPLGAAGAADASEVGGKLFWANFAADSDFLAGPIPGGAETLVQLRSAESPERIPLHLDLPVGAELRATSIGGAEVVRAGEQLAEIAPPSARDADGTAVPARYSVEGSDLVVNVDHRGSDYLYPLLLDPQIEDMRYWQSNPSLDANGWEGRSCSGAPYTNAFMSGGFGKGLYTYTNGTNYFGDGACGYWLWSFLSGTITGTPSVFTYAAEFDLLSTVQESDCAYVGLVNTTGSPLGWIRYVRNCGPSAWSGYSTGLCAQGTYPSCSANPTNVTANNEARLETIASGAGNRSSMATYMGGSVIYLNETKKPTASISSRAPQPTGWADAVPPVLIHGHDPDYGLGVKSFELTVPGEPGPRARTAGCSGDRNYRCQTSKDSDEADVSGASYTVDAASLPEGTNNFSVQTVDMVGNRSDPYSWQVKLDRQLPSLQLDGGLAAHPGTQAQPRQLDHGVYDLTMAASDGYSGVKSLAVSVDGLSEYLVESDPTCDASSGCPANQSGEYQFATEARLPGEHQIDVTATDAVGHMTTTTLYVRTDYSTDCPRVSAEDQLTGRCAEWPGPDSHVSPDTFEGSCSGGGVVSSLLMDGTTIGPLYLWYYDVTDSANGSCTGLLNAQQIANAPATLELATSCIRSSPYIDTRVDGNSGHATLTFTGGTPDPGDDTALSADFQLVGAGDDKLTLSGRNGGTAVGAASFTPAQWSDHCPPDGDQFHIEFQTVTGLHDDS